MTCDASPGFYVATDGIHRLIRDIEELQLMLRARPKCVKPYALSNHAFNCRGIVNRKMLRGCELQVMCLLSSSLLTNDNSIGSCGCVSSYSATVFRIWVSAGATLRLGGGSQKAPD